MKKILLFLIMALLPLMVSADAIEINGIYYNLITKGKIAEVTSNPNKYSGNVVIPEKVEYEGTEYSVKSIAGGTYGGAFNGCIDLTSVTIPNCVTSIGENAFSMCTSLMSIVIPNSVTSIGSGAFYGCSSLLSATISNNITNIDVYTFNRCSSLTTITIPNSVTNIGDYSFEECNNLTSVTIGNSVRTIGREAFSGCGNLFSVIIPNSVTSIGIAAFYGCSNLNSVTISNNLTNIEGATFAGCINLTSVTIPNSVKVIGDAAFESCTGLTSIIIPNCVTNIGALAFEHCTSLTSVTIGNSITAIGDYAFQDCTSLTSVHITNIESWCKISFSRDDSNPLYYAHHLFMNGVEIKNLEISNNVERIGQYAFYGCNGLNTITIGNGIKYIDSYAFANCIELTDLYCKAKKIPTTANEAFDGSYIEYATLHVPTFLINSYKTTAPWSSFGNITSTGEKFKLKYVVDSEEYKTYEIEEGTEIIPEPAPTKEGYTFSGWSEIPETMPFHDVTVTGTFSINKYKLAYIVDGVEYKSYEIEFGASITPETEPTKEGYTFSGWSEIPETMPAQDVTITGTFSVNSYKLIYMVDGEEYKSYEVEYGATITPEAEPTKEGYIFSGWSEIPETMPAHDVTVTGTFTLDTGLSQIMSDENGDAMIFTIDGKRVNKLQKNMNIIRMKDDTTRKVIKK